MRREHYSGGLTREQFLFHEIRIIAMLLCQGKNRNDIITQVKDENLFQFPTERMIGTIANTCFRRIEALESEELVRLLANSSFELCKQINLYAIMCENSIVYDFMTEVIGNKYRYQQFDYSSMDMNAFFMELNERYAASTEWSESTVKKLKQVLNRFLAECGYLENVRSNKLLPVYLFPELEDVIRSKCDLPALAAFNCLL